MYSLAVAVIAFHNSTPCLADLNNQIQYMVIEHHPPNSMPGDEATGFAILSCFIFAVSLPHRSLFCMLVPVHEKALQTPMQYSLYLNLMSNVSLYRGNILALHLFPSGCAYVNIGIVGWLRCLIYQFSTIIKWSIVVQKQTKCRPSSTVTSQDEVYSNRNCFYGMLFVH